MTEHKFITCNSNLMQEIEDKTIDLIVTSPPYPMIEMWDDIFSEQNSAIKSDLNSGNGVDAFKKMHEILNEVWKECDRVLKDNGFVCINIGDATRTIADEFRLYSNHTEIINYFANKGYSVLPDIHWRKQSNAPNKFMGSGMYPAGAYVTYEHEYILIFRKGSKRNFSGEGKQLRQKSAFFWEERNVWFSDLWEIKGTSQGIKSDKANRSRSAAFPFEIPYRLVNMYSAEGDWVLDPFAGLGTTSFACMVSNRNSYALDIDESMKNLAIESLRDAVDIANNIIDERIKKHTDFISELPQEKKDKCYENKQHNFKVKTKQETAIKIDHVSEIEINGYNINCKYI